MTEPQDPGPTHAGASRPQWRFRAPVVAVCGASGSGKTTLVEALVPRLVGRGLAVAVVKHCSHGFELDRPGKDSERLFRAGADVVLDGPHETASRRHRAPTGVLEQELNRLSGSHDVVLVEGHADAPLPKLWLATADDDRALPEGGEVLEVLASGEGRLERAEAIVVERIRTAWAGRGLLGGVLIGGSSRRMARPKQLLEVGGRTLLDRAVEALAPVVDEIVLLGAGELPTSQAGRVQLPDPPGCTGPLAGLLAGLRWAPEACWVVAACDLPLLEPEAVRWLVDQRRPGRWAVLPHTGKGVEPLLALYEPQALRELEALAATGVLAPRRLAELEKVATPEPPQELRRCWFNANTPEDLLSLRER